MLKLQALRERRGLTRRQLAEVALLSNGRVGAFENGRAVPPREGVELRRLARALSLPAADAGSLLDEVGPDGH
jgi:transcriptional regulator with XRE-family HTH domain